MFTHIQKVAVLTLILLAFAMPIFPQATDASLTGTVLDASGAAVPNANLELINDATGVRFTTATTANGDYRFPNVPIGTYTLNATGAGFATNSIKNINLQLNRTATVNVTMQVSNVSTTVEVTDAGATIDTSTAQVQSTFNTSQIVNMPIIESSGNSFGALNLSLLSAGVASNGGVGQGTGPSIGGQRPMNNNFNVEGVDNNNKAVTGPLVYVPTEATAEFTLLQNQFSPEFGHSSGGQFNLIVKSGTNEVHGSLYEYFQNRNLNAIDQSTRNQGYTSNPRYDQNRLGASIGGPVIKNKLFYFGNFEYAPLGEAFVPSSTVKAPTAAGYATLSGLSGISKTNLGVLQQFLPAAATGTSTLKITNANNQAVANIPIGPINTAGSFYTNQYTAVASMDYTMGSNDQLRGRFITNKIDTLDNAASLPAFWVTQPNRYYLVSIAQYHNFTPNLTNELRLAYNRYNQTYPVPNYQFPGLDKFPNIELNQDLNVNLGPNGNAPQFTIQNTYQAVDNLSWNKGSHNFKFGYDVRKYISPQRFIQRERGDYSYTSLSLFLYDQIPDDIAERNVGDTIYYGDQIANYAYANDTWRIRPNFTLNLGLRYEYTTVPYTMRLQGLNSVSDVPGVISFKSPQPMKNAWAPRVGFAWSPGNSGNTSIRAGFGMAYDVIFDNVGSTSYPPQLSSTIDVDPTVASDAARYTPFLAKGGIPPNAQASGVLSQADARAATSSYLPDFKLPYSIQWNFGVQHVFRQNWTVEARYLGTRGAHLIVQSRFNRVARVDAQHFLPTYLQAPSQSTLDASQTTLAALNARTTNTYAQYGFTSNITGFLPQGNSIYHGMALQVNRRFAGGFQMVGAYTWSHNIDDSTATHFSTILTPRRPQDFQNIRVDRANSALDRRHRVTVNAMYDTPWLKDSSWFAKNIIGNWRVVGTYTYESPEYATVQSGVDSNLNGDAWPDRTIINPSGAEFSSSDVTPLCSGGPCSQYTTSAARNAHIVGYLATTPNARYIKAGLGALANAGRNTLPMEPINNLDMSLAKSFSMGERRRLEFRADAANVMNHAQFTPGYVNTVRLTTQTNTRAFLLAGNPDFYNLSRFFPSNARSLQLVAKFVF